MCFLSLDVIDDADIAAHKPYVRPEPVRIPVYRDENERKPGVEVPEDQIFQVVTFNGSLARLKCMRNPVATPSPPQTPPPQLPPPIPMPEEGNSSQLGSLGQLEPPNMFFSEVEAPKKVLLQMTAPRLVLLQVRTAKVAAPKKGFAQQGATIAMNNSWFVQLQKGPPKTVLLQARAPPNEQPSTQPAEPKLVPLMIIPPKIVRPQADVPKGLPSQQGSQEGTLKTRNLVLIQVKTPPQEALPPQGELPQEAPQPVADDDKPPIEKVVIRLIDNVNAVRSSSSIMKQHDYALPSTSGRMAKEELDDIHASKFADYLIFCFQNFLIPLFSKTFNMRNGTGETKLLIK